MNTLIMSTKYIYILDFYFFFRPKNEKNPFLQDGGIEVEIKPEMYVIPTKGRKTCKPAFMPIDVAPSFGHAYLLGSIPYMTHYFTLFRRGRAGEPSMVRRGLIAARVLSITIAN